MSSATATLLGGSSSWSWNTLDDATKLSYIDSGAQLKIGNRFAWHTTDNFEDNVWTAYLRPKLENVVTKNLKQIFGSQKGSFVFLECYMTNSSDVWKQAKPTVVVSCTDPKYAPKVISVFNKNPIIRRLQAGVEYYADPYPSDATLAARETALRPPNFGVDTHTLSGTRIVVVPQGESDRPTWRYATLGGLIQINGIVYGVTAAHVFRKLPKDKGRAPDGTDDGESASSRSSASDVSSVAHPSPQPLPVVAKVYVDPGTYTRTSDDENQHEILRQDEATVLRSEHELGEFRGRDSKGTRLNRNLDWAVFEIADPSLHLPNTVKLDHGTVSCSETALTQARGQVVVIAGFGGTSIRHTPGRTSGMLIPGASRMVTAWKIIGQSLAGDCGSWVVDLTTGQVYGLLVATSKKQNCSYCVSMSTVFDSIGTSLGQGFPTVYQPGQEPSLLGAPSNHQNGDADHDMPDANNEDAQASPIAPESSAKIERILARKASVETIEDESLNNSLSASNAAHSRGIDADNKDKQPSFIAPESSAKTERILARKASVETIKDESLNEALSATNAAHSRGLAEIPPELLEKNIIADRQSQSLYLDNIDISGLTLEEKFAIRRQVESQRAAKSQDLESEGMHPDADDDGESGQQSAADKNTLRQAAVNTDADRHSAGSDYDEAYDACDEYMLKEDVSEWRVRHKYGRSGAAERDKFIITREDPPEPRKDQWERKQDETIIRRDDRERNKEREEIIIRRYDHARSQERATDRDKMIEQEEIIIRRDKRFPPSVNKYHIPRRSQDYDNIGKLIITRRYGNSSADEIVIEPGQSSHRNAYGPTKQRHFERDEHTMPTPETQQGPDSKRRPGYSPYPDPPPPAGITHRYSQSHNRAQNPMQDQREDARQSKRQNVYSTTRSGDSVEERTRSYEGSLRSRIDANRSIPRNEPTSHLNNALFAEEQNLLREGGLGDNANKKQDRVRDVPVSNDTLNRRSTTTSGLQDIEIEATYYNDIATHPMFSGEAQDGVLKDWSFVDVPPGTERVIMLGRGGAGQEITWQGLEDLRRSEFYPVYGAVAPQGGISFVSDGKSSWKNDGAASPHSKSSLEPLDRSSGHELHKNEKQAAENGRNSKCVARKGKTTFPRRHVDPKVLADLGLPFRSADSNSIVVERPLSCEAIDEILSLSTKVETSQEPSHAKEETNGVKRDPVWTESEAKWQHIEKSLHEIYLCGELKTINSVENVLRQFKKHHGSIAEHEGTIQVEIEDEELFEYDDGGEHFERNSHQNQDFGTEPRRQGGHRDLKQSLSQPADLSDSEYLQLMRRYRAEALVWGLSTSQIRTMLRNIDEATTDVQLKKNRLRSLLDSSTAAATNPTAR